MDLVNVSGIPPEHETDAAGGAVGHVTTPRPPSPTVTSVTPLDKTNLSLVAGINVLVTEPMFFQLDGDTI